MKLVKNTLRTNLSLKTASLIFGFFCWFIFSSTEHSSLTLTVPLCFFGDEEQKKISCPFDTIEVSVAGKRADLYALDRGAVALHVDLDELDPGDHLLEVTREKLFLPASLKVVHLSPSNPVVTISEKVA